MFSFEAGNRRISSAIAISGYEFSKHGLNVQK
jgi:hypothetical protein